MEELKAAPKNFIEEFIEQDIEQKGLSHIQTRFPPEPNGYLHIGHAKALFVDFSMAEKFGGKCNLRFDDTNPTKEDVEYVDAIKYDIHWLGFDWDQLRFGSEYFDTCYELAVKLIKKGVAYVDDLTKDEMREYRGTLTEPGKNSPWRERSVDENLDLFTRMKNGEFPDGSRTLRARIDMASPNINLRDPALYRILHIPHHQTGDKWCIYPMYDFAHPIQDAIEGITHSLCSLEYEAHRPLYDWVVEQCEFEHKPRQIEFARLNLTNTIMSKRYLRRLVEEGYVSGWDDPRMPTLVAMRRRGYPPEAIRDFIERVGVAKADSEVDGALLEHCVREALGESAPRAMAVLRPLKVTLSNWGEDEIDELTMENHPDHPEMGERTVKFGKVLYIEREDFMEDPPKKFFRLAPGREVRLKGAYIIRCDEVVKDESGNVVELRCSADLTSKSGSEGAARKVKGTLHWVACADCIDAEVRLYGDLFGEENMGELPEGKTYDDYLNPESVQVLPNAKLEPALKDARPGERFQFVRMGYFTPDSKHPGVYNRIVTLKDSFKL